MASMCFTIAVNEFLTWLRRTKKRSDIAFSLICLGGAFFCLFCSGEYSVDAPLQSIPWLKGEVIAISLTVFALFWYISEETKLIKNKFVFAYLIWNLLVCLSQLINLGDLTWVAGRPFISRVDLPFGLHFIYREVERGILLIIADFVGFGLLVYLVSIVAKFRRLGHRRESTVLFMVLGVAVLAEINDFLVGIGLYSFLFLMEYAWLAVVLIVGLRRSNEVIELHKSLMEKQTLLRELYHRTKNNMNVIISMLKLQSREIGDARLKKAFGETEDRIISMSLVHEKLYEAQDLSHINLKEYFEDLIKHIIANYNLSNDPPTLSLDMQNVFVLIETAIACGLIVNELISNTLKYAFPSGRAGEIRVLLHQDENEEITLVVSDNGIGLPPEFDAKRDGHLGMRLIDSLARGKLRTEAVLETDRGVSCRLVFMDTMPAG